MIPPDPDRDNRPVVPLESDVILSEPEMSPATRRVSDTAQEKHDQTLLNTLSPINTSPDQVAAVSTDDRDVEAISRVVTTGPAYSIFPRRTKAWITFMSAVACFISPMTANIYYPVLDPIARDLGVDIALINLTITSYMVLQAIAPTLFGDFGDMAGRRPAYILAFSIYLCANIGLALQRNYAALLVLRMVQSGGSSGAIALGFAMVADISMSSERGVYMGLVGAGVNVGPTIGPVIGGLLTQYLGWSAIFWFCAILGGVWLVTFALAVPETCRNVVGNGSAPAQGWNKTFIDFVRKPQSATTATTTTTATGPEEEAADTTAAVVVVQKPKLRFPNPVRAIKIILDKEMALILLYNSILYTAFIDVSATLGTLFKEIYGFTDLEVGLCYLPYGAGCCVASVGQGYILDWNYRRIARKIGFVIDRRRGDDLSEFPIEKARLQPVYPTLAVGLVALTVYGWVMQARTCVAVPLVVQFVIGLCIPGSFSILNTLIVDLNPAAPATATAANNLVRCLMGAAGTASIEYMIYGIGKGWSFTFLAALCLVLSPALPVIVRYGPQWRREKKEAAEEKKKKKKRGAESAARDGEPP